MHRHVEGVSDLSDIVRTIRLLLAEERGKTVRAVSAPPTLYATVARIDQDGSAWVRIDGGEGDTPATCGVSCRSGDRVTVIIEGNRARVTGNVSNPPTDDRAAESASRQASQATSDAHVAHMAAEAAQQSANNAQTDAQRALNAADAAQTAANNAQTSADTAASAASAAQTSANSAIASATRANTHADDALNSLSVVQDVAGTLSWISEHGSYVPTVDTAVVEGRVYFALVSGAYVPVTNPTGNPSAQGWYVLDVTDSQADYVMAHIAVTSAGLWVLPSGIDYRLTTDTEVMAGQTYYELVEMQVDGATYSQYVEVTPVGTEDPSEEGWYIWPTPDGASGYKMLLASDGMYLCDDTGHVVVTYGESITFDSSRPQRIGGDEASITWYDSDTDGVPDSIAIAGNVTFSSVEAIDGMLSDIAQTANDLGTAVEDLRDGIEDASKVATNFLRIDPTLGVVLAKQGSQISNVLSNDSMRFMTDSGEDVAHIGLTEEQVWEMAIATARIESQLRFNDFAWIRRANGNMTLKWLGTTGV